MTSHVTATFSSRADADKALLELERLGISEDQIGVVVTDETRENNFNIEKGSKATEGFTTGATVGGLAGGVWGALATAAATTVPGFNVILAGAAVSLFAGLGAGATAGGLIGALVGAGMTEHEAKIIEDEVKNGAILIAVKPESDDQKDKIENLLERQDPQTLAA